MRQFTYNDNHMGDTPEVIEPENFDYIFTDMQPTLTTPTRGETSIYTDDIEYERPPLIRTDTIMQRNGIDYPEGENIDSVCRQILFGEPIDDHIDYQYPLYVPDNYAMYIDDYINNNEEIMNNHTESMNNHTEIMNNHTESMNNHTESMNNHTESMNNLDFINS